ncbi:MAG TPA: hypothetical protein VI076_12930 [Actinopolymorphaceae bacterium]
MHTYGYEALSRQHRAEALERAMRHRALRTLRARRRQRMRLALAARLRALADRVDPRPLRASIPAQRA